MNAFFKEILDYHYYYNQKLLDAIRENIDKLPSRTFPLYCHVLNAHQIWNSRIAQTASFGRLDLHPIHACNEINEKNFKDTETILTTEELSKHITYTNTNGQSFANTIQDILFHVFNHSTHHKAQIISDFRQSGIEPMITDYIFYKR